MIKKLFILMLLCSPCWALDTGALNTKSTNVTATSVSTPSIITSSGNLALTPVGNVCVKGSASCATYNMGVDGTLYGQGVYDTGNLVGWVRVGTASPSGAGATTFNITTGVFYRMVATNVHASTGGHDGLRFNGDAANHTNLFIYASAAAAGVAFSNNTASTDIYMITCTTNDNTTMVIDFVSLQGAPHNAMAVFNGYNDNATRTYVTGGGKYTGAANISTVSYITSAGSYSGTINLYKYQ